MKHLLVLLVVTSVGCKGAGELYHGEEYAKRPTLNASLLKDAKAMLSEEAIKTLLESRIRIPERAKIAILPLGHTSTHAEESGWGAQAYSRQVEIPQERKTYLEALELPLAQTGRLSEITHVPSLMLPQEISLTRLREVAALMQADLLLVYSTKSLLISWRAFMLLAPDEVRAVASIELILLDVRTGVVPYAETFDAEHVERENSDDYSLADTQRRAEKTGTLKVMGLAADGLKRFISR